MRFRKTLIAAALLAGLFCLAGAHWWYGEEPAVTQVEQLELPPLPLPAGGFPPPVAPAQPAHKVEEPAKVVWAFGTVADETGRAVEGADVVAHASWHGGLRQVDGVVKARTDSAGRWEIKGEDRLTCFSGSLVFHKEGHPPGVVPLRDFGDRRYELVLPSRGGKLEVAVLCDGKPLPGAGVRIAPRRGFGEPDMAILMPTAKADGEGVARFHHLRPGAYDVAAWEEPNLPDDEEVRTYWKYLRKPKFTIRWGIAVRAAQTNSYRIAIYEQPSASEAQWQHTDGKALPDPAVTWTATGSDLPHALCLDTGPRATGGDGPGIWAVHLRSYKTSREGWRVSDAPFFEAAGVVAVSGLLPMRKAQVLTAWERQPGSVTVYLQDEDGKPVRGEVHVGRWETNFTGKTDATGKATFPRVQEAEYTIDAFPDGDPVFDLDKAPFPPDTKLTRHRAFLSREVNVTNDTDSEVKLRLQPAGYMRGVIRPAAPRSCADYSVGGSDTPLSLRRKVTGSDGYQSPPFGQTTFYDEKTGEWLIGPLPEGKATLKVYLHRGKGFPSICLTKEVLVRSNRVAHVELNPPAEVEEETPPPEPAFAWIEDSLRKSTGETLPARVLLPDGKTPVCGAVVSVYLPGRDRPICSGSSDARGRIHLRADRVRMAGEPYTPVGPEGAVVVAQLPGSHGAAIRSVVEKPEDGMKLVLPPVIAVRGRVTVGGKGAESRNTQITVLAAPVGRGKLTELLSVEAHTQADGSFELAGLTPGEYRIQAALDGIWLSQSVTLTAKPGQKLDPLKLDIAEPGHASLLEIVTAKGAPLPRAVVSVSPPAGPLAERLWPRSFTADGRGALALPPLPAGAHAVRVRGYAKRHELTVPRLTESERPATRIVAE